MKRPENPVFSQLSAHFQRLDRAAHFTSGAWRLYYHLLHCFHEAEWPTTLRLKQRHLASAFDVTDSTLAAARKELQARGLLRWKRSNLGNPASWELVLPDTPIRRPRDPDKRPAQRVCSP
ncbi:cyclic nucleotide-binding domain-containing protein [Hymenobacter baengnokdamensis]|uniref:hypothetical protein n=1 Tax=Hymenobacter baengnokdamensis TaxID=2615203 RepID=UPI0012451A67|nr:hypothetical protein [Hymenobacter baengnokdamensis]